MPVKKTVYRYLLCVLGIFIITLGIGTLKQTDLGISPISSPPNVLSMRFTSLTFGTWFFIMNIVYVLLQVAILGKKFPPFQLMQIPFSVLFGWFSDLGIYITDFINPATYIARVAIVFIGVLILGVGISVSIIANVILNPPDAFYKTVSEKWGVNVGIAKLCTDIISVLIAVILGIVLLGRIDVVGIGTLITAVFTGYAVKFFHKLLKTPLEKFIAK